MTRFQCFGVPALIVSAGIAATSAYGQSCCRLHDTARDNLAQQAAEAAKKIGNASLFQKELANLEALQKLEIDSVFRGESVFARDLLNEIVLSNWTALDTRFAAFAATVKTQAQAAKDQLAKIKSDLGATQARVDELQKQTPAPSAAPRNPVNAVVTIVANGVDADNTATALLANVKGKGGTDAVKFSALVGQVLAEANTAAKTVQSNQQAVVDTQVELRKLALDLNTLSIRRLSLQADDLRDRARVYDREAQLLTEITNLIDGYNDLLKRLFAEPKAVSGIDHDTPIVQTMNIAAEGARGNKDADAKRLSLAIAAVYDATSIAGRWNTAELVTKLRLAQLDHRTSILKSQLEAQAYETAIGNGAQRLAIFYRGGVRPETIAQLVQAFSTAAIPWAITSR